MVRRSTTPRARSTNFHETCTRVAATPDNVVISEFLRFKEDGGRESYEQFAAAFQPMLEAIWG